MFRPNVAIIRFSSESIVVGRRPNYPHVVHTYRYAASYNKHRTN